MFKNIVRKKHLIFNRLQLVTIVYLIEKYTILSRSLNNDVDLNSVWQGVQSSEDVSIKQTLRIFKRRLGE